MRTTRKVLVATFTSIGLATLGSFFTLPAHGQDAPSLGDVARQARLQKQQKEAQAKDSAPSDESEKESDKGKDTPGASAANDAQGADAKTKDAPAKDAPGKATDADAKTAQPAQSAKTPHLITNEDLPEHVVPTRVAAHGLNNPDAPAAAVEKNDGPKAPAEYWKHEIQAQKNAIVSLESQMNLLNDSIQYASGNCVSNCVQWNERQKQKQDQVETMKAQLEEQQKHLEDLQDQARKQGYGSSVYDP
jgi:hypothetical protein